MSQKPIRKKKKLCSEREALKWIKEVTKITPASSTSIFESCKDGVLLCQLINAIQPGAIPKINQKSFRYLKIENISFFIRNSKRWGVPQQDCMSAADLVDNSNIRQVLINIESMSRVIQTNPEINWQGPYLGSRIAKRRDSSDFKWDLGYKYDDDGFNWKVTTEDGTQVRMTGEQMKEYHNERIAEEEEALKREKAALKRQKELAKEEQKKASKRGKKQKGFRNNDPVQLRPAKQKGGGGQKKLDVEVKCIIS